MAHPLQRIERDVERDWLGVRRVGWRWAKTQRKGRANMNTAILLWGSAALLFLLCIPTAGTRRFVLEVFAFVLRISMWAVLIAGGVLWFHPEWLPRECANFVNTSPELSRFLPAPGTQVFGLTAACFIAAVTLPCLAMLDVTRQLAGERLRRLREMADSAALTDTVVVRETASEPVITRQALNGPRRVIVQK
jgi:hypothetical protein